MGHCCIFENALAQPTDPWLSNSKSKILTHDKEIYHFLSSRDTECKKIEHVIEEASNAYPLLIGILSSMENENITLLINNKLQMQKISTRELEILAEKSEKLIISAYDGEGYLIWTWTEAGRP